MINKVGWPGPPIPKKYAQVNRIGVREGSHQPDPCFTAL
jgi:hypothetical protein